MTDGNNLKISVIVRTFRRPEFLKRALRSVELQTYSNWEVLIYDDSGDLDNLHIVNNFKSNNKTKRVLYITSFEPGDLFKKSWIYSISDSYGDVIVRLDDDDILDCDALSYINLIYSKYSDLDFSYGSSVVFKNNELVLFMESRTPYELPKTTSAWLPYTIENNHPWKDPWSFASNYYEIPQNYSSIIHASKANELCVYHTYVMRKKSIEAIIDKINITSHTHDDLEFLSSLEYLGLKHTSIKKVLTFVEAHNSGRVTETKDIIEESIRVKDFVDYLRPNNFKTNILYLENNFVDEIGITNELKYKFKKLLEQL